MYKIPDEVTGFSHCNCDQALFYLSIIHEMLKYYYTQKHITPTEKRFHDYVENLLTSFNKDYPTICLSEIFEKVSRGKGLPFEE